MKLVFMVGNGFNHFISDYLNSSAHEKQIIAKVDQYAKTEGIRNTWINNSREVMKNYCCLLDDIYLSDMNDSTKGEFLLSAISDFSQKVGDENNEITENLVKLVTQKVNDDMVEANNSAERTSISETINTIMGIKNRETFGYTLLNELNGITKITKANIFTTNYDKLTNRIFRVKHSDFKVFRNSLHGEYDDSKGIICCPPDYKELKLGGQYPEKLEKFEASLDEMDMLFLIGIGLSSDPHLLRRINEVKNKQIIVIDHSVDGYFKNRSYRSNSPRSNGNPGFDFLYNNSIHFLSTQEFSAQTNNQIQKPIETPEDLVSNIVSTFNSIHKSEVL